MTWQLPWALLFVTLVLESFVGAGASAAPPLYELDWTGLSVDHPVRAHAPDCSGVAGTRVLRGALVTYSRKGGLSTWGHSSVRFQVCEGRQFRDVEFEAFRLSANERAILLEEYPDLNPEHLESQAGALVWFANEPVVDRGFYHQMQARNRDIFELWFEPDRAIAEGVDLTTLYEALDQRHRTQLARLRAHRNLEVRYRALGPNCTAVFADLDLPGITPFAYLRRFEDQAHRRVMHPSHHTVRRLLASGPQDVPAFIPRPSPVFRWSPQLSPSVQADLEVVLQSARPVGLPEGPVDRPARAGYAP